MTDQIKAQPENEVELLSFRIGDQEYSVDIMAVREIRGWTKATPLPFSPPHVKGVINLRGTVLPVVDLSVRLGMEAINEANENVIIVVNHEGSLAGMLVDAVSDILTVATEEMQSPPEFGVEQVPRCIASIFMNEGKLVRVLDLRAVLPSEAVDVA